MISSGFSVFPKFWFLGLLEGLKGKNGPKWEIITYVTSHMSGTLQHMIFGKCLVNICKMMISLGVFFQFFKVLIFLAVRVVKGQKTVQNEK